MNKQAVAHYLCRITAWGSLLFLFPALVSLIYGEWDSLKVFLEVAVGTAVLSLPMALIKPKDSDMFAKEALMIVALPWERDSMSVRIVEPVVVNPETLSKTASTNDGISPEIQNGSAPATG